MVLAFFVALCWFVRFLAVPMNLLDVSGIPFPSEVPTLTYIDILSLVFGGGGILITRYGFGASHENVLAILGIACDAVSIYLALWGSTLIS